MFDIPDNYDIWSANERRKDAALARMPVCFHCKQHIQQDMAVHLDIGWLCEDCIKNNMEEVNEDGY